MTDPISGRRGRGVSNTRNQAIANFVQQLKNDGTWDLIDRTMIPGPSGPLNKADMEAIWARQRRLTDTGMVYGIGPAVDLAQLQDAMGEFSRQPWDLPPPQGGEVDA